MKQLLIGSILTLIILNGYTQEHEQEPHYTYLSLNLAVYTNTPGTIKQKLFSEAEVGRTYGIFDIGFSVGRLNYVSAKGGIDSTWFAEIVPTINVFSKGKFSEALTLGAGRIFNRRENFLTEVTNSINFAPNSVSVITIYQGNYFFDGKYSTSKAQFMGMSVTYNFIKRNTRTAALKKKALFSN